MAKTTAAPAAPPAAPSMLALSEERDKLIEFFEAGCLQAAQDGEDMLPWDCLQAGRQLGLSDNDIENARLRMQRVAALRPVAGTAADLDADTAAAKTASEKLAAEAPALRAQIEALERKLKALEDAAQAAEERRFRRAQARETLRDVAKRAPWHADRYNRARHRAEMDFAALPAMEARVKLASAVAALTDESAKLTHLAGASRDTDHPDTARLAAAALHERVERNIRQVTLNEAAWSLYVEALTAEAEALRPEVEALTAARAEALVEPERILDVYLP